MMTTQQQANNRDLTLDERAFPRDTGELEAGDTAPLESVGFRPTHIRNTNHLVERRDHADLGGVWGRTASRGSRRDAPCK